MQKEIVNGGPLLDLDGHLIEKGYAKSLIKDYQRSDIKANKLRIKEWDYYLVYNEEYAIALTFDDNSYMGLMSVSVIDFKNQREKTVSPMQFMSKGNHHLPSTSKHGDCIYHSKKIDMLFRHVDGKRVLECKLPNFHEDSDFECHLELTNEPKESMVIITPFKDKPKAFYYNQKIVGFKVNGYFKVGYFKYEFKENDTRAILDYAFENFSKVAVTEDMVEVSGFKSINPNAHVTLPSGITFDQLDCAVDNPTALGDKSGKLIYTYEGQPVGEVEFTITDEYYNQIHGIEEVKEKDKSDKKNADKGQAIGIVIRIVFGILGVVLVLFLLLICYVAYKRHQIRKRRKMRRLKRQRELEYQRYLERMQDNDKNWLD